MNGPRHGMDDMDGTRIEEERLRSALRPLRPDPEEFLRGVRARIARGESEAESREARSPWLRSAAALLPPGLVRDELLGSTLGLAGKQGLAGFAGAVLVAPALALLAVLATFLLSLRRVARSGAGAPSNGEPRSVWQAELTSLAQLTQGTQILAVGLTFLGCWFLAPNLTLALLAVSMAGLAWLLARLGQRGLTSRRVVGSVCGQLLFWLGLLGLQFAHFHPDGYLASAPPALFALGSLGCGLLTWRSWAPLRASSDPQLQRALAPRRRGPWEIRAAHSRVHLVLALLLVAYALPTALQRPADRADLVRYVEDFDPASKSPKWAGWSLVAAHLLRDGGPPPRLERVAAGLHARLDRGESVDPFTLRWAARADLLRPADFETLADPASFARSAEGTGWIPFLEQRALTILSHARLHGLEEGERERIVERLLASIEPEPVHDGVRKALVAVETLEALGEGQAVAERTAAIHAQLLASWGGGSRPRAATGFSSMIEGGHSSSAAFFYTDTTFEALELVARVGLPEGIDARRVRRFLEDASRDPHLFFLRRDYRMVAAAGLRRLAGLDLASAPDAAEWLVRLRIFLPPALLALFCVLATALAPRSTSEPRCTDEKGQ